MPKIIDTNFPYNLYDEVFKDEDLEEEKHYPEDFEGSVQYVLTTLTERERVIILYRYTQGLTYDAIARIMGVTRERIHQVEAKALRKLRHPKRSKYFKLGVSGVIESVIQSELALEKEKSYQAGYKDGYRDGSIDPMETVGGFGAKNSYVALDWKIEELDLSTRSYNALRRAGIDNVRDICLYDDLRRIRNLGKTSRLEIICKLEELSLDCTEARKKLGLPERGSE